LAISEKALSFPSKILTTFFSHLPQNRKQLQTFHELTINFLKFGLPGPPPTKPGPGQRTPWPPLSGPVFNSWTLNIRV